jgi:hypothetical protein
MKLRNYTSNIAVDRSLEAIDTLLRQAGATHTARAYKDGAVDAVMFQLNVNGRPYSFRLPSNPDAVFKVMMADIQKPQRGTEERVKEQSLRTAWSLVREWVHIQLSMIQLQQAEALEVFLPYLYDGKNDRTFYTQLKETGFKQLQAAVGV